MGFLKNVVAASASNLLGDDYEDLKSQFADVKKQIKDQADASGITEGINKARASIDSGKSKIQEFTSEIKEPSIEKVIQNNPNNVVVMPVNVQPQGDNTKAESEYNSLSAQMDQIVKLKELVDMGILSQEEFDKKKREVLGL